VNKAGANDAANTGGTAPGVPAPILAAAAAGGAEAGPGAGAAAATPPRGV